MHLELSKEAHAILLAAREEAMRTGYYAVGVEHIVLALLRNSDSDIVYCLDRLGVSAIELKELIDSRIMKSSAVPFYDLQRIQPSIAASELIRYAGFEAVKSGSRFVQPKHILLAVCCSGCGTILDYFSSKSVKYSSLLKAMAHKKAASPKKKKKQLVQYLTFPKSNWPS